MLVQLFTVVLPSLIVTARTDTTCETWEHHKNFGLVHSGGDCGRMKVKEEDTFSPRILLGETPQPGSLPWMALVIIEKKYGCGGSVINENYILTAAHCMVSENDSMVVLLGLHDIRQVSEDPTEIYDVSKCIRHPGFRETNNKNDIALLRLDRSISFESPYINYICLPTSCELSEKTFQGEKLTMAGWGFINKDQPATTLQKMQVPVKECKRYFMTGLTGEVISPDDTQLCAGSDHSIGCGGDSGGPLVYKSAGRFVQVGILSFGPLSCTSSDHDQFDTYIRVSSFMDWILDNISA